MGGIAIAVIGDVPYAKAQERELPAHLAAIDADAEVVRVVHVGDVKAGGAPCTEAGLRKVRTALDALTVPVVYTPGDNEWTDCHRDGRTLPTDALANVRRVFFTPAGATLGKAEAVVSQEAPTVENVRWTEARTVFATLHVVGSNDDGAPWFGDRRTPAQAALQADEQRGRREAALRWIDATFAAAGDEQAAAVVFAMQADPFVDFPGFDAEAFRPVVERLAAGANAFGKPVLLLHGDTHQALADAPLAGPDAAGTQRYGVTAPNLRRVVVAGDEAASDEWTKLRVDPDAAAVFSWEQVRYP